MAKSIAIENHGDSGRFIPGPDGLPVFVPAARKNVGEDGKTVLDIGKATYADAEFLAKLIAERPLVKHFFATGLKADGDLPAVAAQSQQQKGSK